MVAEAYFACQHHYGIPKEAALAGLRELLSKPTFHVHTALLELLSRENIASTNPGFIDRLIHAEYAANGLSLATFEKPARRLSHTQVLDGSH